MRIILTGGTGFIGSAVLRRLLEAGHEVTATVRSESSASKLPQDAAAVVGDLTDLTWTTKQFAAADAVISAASPGDESSAAFGRAVADAAVAALAGTGTPYVQTGGIWDWGEQPPRSPKRARSRRRR